MPTSGTSLLTAEELLRRASELVPVLKERAAHTEELRRIPDETVHDLLSSGLHRIAVPKRYGGLDVGYDLTLDVGAELARGCSAAAWCYSLWSAHAWMVGHWPLEAQEELFSEGPDVLCSSSLSPYGVQLEPVDGGYRMVRPLGVLQWVRFSYLADAWRTGVGRAPVGAGPPIRLQDHRHLVCFRPERHWKQGYCRR